MQDEPGRHRIVVCSRCVDARLGLPAVQTLKTKLLALLADHELSAVRVDEVACMAGCERPTAVAFTAPGKATYLFGDIDAATDAPNLLAFLRLYRTLPDGWSNEGQRPRALAGKTLARIPALQTASAVS
jgi:predicted metal-binding protein